MSENKSWPVIETYTGAAARPLTFQVWDGYGDKWDGTGFTCTLKLVLGEAVVESALAMTALEEHAGLYYTHYNFTAPGEYKSQITVENGVGDKDYCEPVTIKVKEPV